MTTRARVAFVTGGARGIGRAFADALVEDGCAVVLADASPEAAQTASKDIGPDRAFGVTCDVGDEKTVQTAVDAAVERFGGIDILINNAARHLMAWSRPVTEVSTAQWRDIFDVNVLIEGEQLIKRQGRVGDLVGAMRFFCSPDSSFVTGETLIVGGGFPLRV